MPDQLSDLLHRSVDDVAVPHAPAYDILGRGRSLRRRRRVATGMTAAVAVIAVGAAGVVLTDVGGDSRSDSNVTDQRDSATSPLEAYRQNGAWAVGDELTIGDTTVKLPGAPTYLAQTSAGVVAQVVVPPNGSTFVLVRPDGTQSSLGIPASTPTINGDLGASRVAWAVPGVDEYELHVWDVDANQEVGDATVPAPGVDPVEGNQFFTPAYLDGDFAYLGVDDGTGRRVDWRTGTVATLDKGPFSVRTGILSTQETDGWSFSDAATGSQLSALGQDFANPLLSPDGRFAATIRSTETESWIGFASVADARFTEIPDFVAVPVWTPGGRMLSFSEDGSAVVLCTTAGDCEEQPIDTDLAEQGALLADYLNVG